MMSIVVVAVEIEERAQSVTCGKRNVSLPLPLTERMHNCFQLRRFPNIGEAVRREGGEARDLPGSAPSPADVPRLSLAATAEQKKKKWPHE
jgi:hypothetical protein